VTLRFQWSEVAVRVGSQGLIGSMGTGLCITSVHKYRIIYGKNKSGPCGLTDKTCDNFSN
jgi:hypothetical protein